VFVRRKGVRINKTGEEILIFMKTSYSKNNTINLLLTKKTGKTNEKSKYGWPPTSFLLPSNDKHNALISRIHFFPGFDFARHFSTALRCMNRSAAKPRSPPAASA
jgi:hypothetical protein